MDPLADIITLLRPKAVLSKLVSGAGNWAVRYSEFGHPSFALVLEGPCWLAVEGQSPVQLEKGDFVFLPKTPEFTLSSDLVTTPVLRAPDPENVNMVRHGDGQSEPSVLLQSGYFHFDPVNAPVLLNHLPALIHLSSPDAGVDSVTQIITLIDREARGDGAGRDLILERLVEILLLEALRSGGSEAQLRQPGLLAGLRDPQIATALRIMHADVSENWSVEKLGRQAGMSRSSFANRFARTVGITPIEYLAQLRMALARDMLRRENRSLSEVAEAIGYESTSAFSTAFSRRYNGISPGAFARNKVVTD